MMQVSRHGVDRSARGQREPSGDGRPGADEPRDEAGKIAPRRDEHNSLLDAGRFGISLGMHFHLLHPIRVLSTEISVARSGVMMLLQ